MSVQPGPEAGGGGGEGPGTLTVASKLSAYLSGGGVLVPFVTAFFAFLVGGIVVALSGANPLETYQAIFNGSGLNWFLPWISSEDRTIAAQNLQQTLILVTPLILTGLSVAYAFRAGLFNIGGQGQYLAGAFAAVSLGAELHGLPGFLHVLVCFAGAIVAAGLWGGLAGWLKAATGANEVISTIMLNWTAIWIGTWLFQLNGPLQNDSDRSVPVSNDIVEGVRLPVWWGDPELQGLHVGLFIALAVTVLFWVLLNRSVTGYEVRAVGFNPDAAEYGGISPGRTYVKVMVVCGVLAGLAGAIDVLGWQFRIATNDIQLSSLVAFLGIAVALLGRNTALGVVVSSVLFGALLNGSSVRSLDPEVFDPLLATNLTTIIQGLVILFVSAPILVTWVWSGARRLGLARGRVEVP
jgi:ABC-type uncharacterized transport system permease subunit